MCMLYVWYKWSYHDNNLTKIFETKIYRPAMSLSTLLPCPPTLNWSPSLVLMLRTCSSSGIGLVVVTLFGLLSVFPLLSPLATKTLKISFVVVMKWINISSTLLSRKTFPSWWPLLVSGITTSLVPKLKLSSLMINTCIASLPISNK